MGRIDPREPTRPRGNIWEGTWGPVISTIWVHTETSNRDPGNLARGAREDRDNTRTNKQTRSRTSTDRGRVRKRNDETDRLTDGWGGLADNMTNKKDIERNRKSDTNRQTDRQTDRQTNKRTHACPHASNTCTQTHVDTDKGNGVPARDALFNRPRANKPTTNNRGNQKQPNEHRAERPQPNA